MSESHFQPLQEKEFKSTIPEHLLDKLSESERYMVQTMSKLENQSDWLAGSIRVVNQAVIELDKRTSTIEGWQARAEPRLHGLEAITPQVKALWDWRNNFTGRTGVIVLMITIFVPVLVKFLLDLWLRKP